MTPLDYYHDLCAKGLITQDAYQLDMLQQFQRIYHGLIKEHKARQRLTAFLRQPHRVKGLYLWGGVGVGKTFLMDCFFHCIPFSNKMRMHFHPFMRLIHKELKKYEGKKDPLMLIADDLAKNNLLICFDEFFVTDITDAMLLGRLFTLLFAKGVCLVATSNVMPDDLYKNGLQRKSFLPAIEMLKRHTEVTHILSTNDYRLQYMKKEGVYYTPHNEHAIQSMEKIFYLLSDNASAVNDPLRINEREIQIIKRAKNVIWFDYQHIAMMPRSQNDYLEIVKDYHAILISNIPVIPPDAKNQITLFIKMIDVFYDYRVQLICSAAGTIDAIYSEGSMSALFERTRSRLLEMQSAEYIAQTTLKAGH